jgi:hypothetical protein
MAQARMPLMPDGNERGTACARLSMHAHEHLPCSRIARTGHPSSGRRTHAIVSYIFIYVRRKFLVCMYTTKYHHT